MFRHLRQMSASLLATLLLLGLLAGPVGAADFRAGDQLTIAAGETISEDVYLAAGSLLVEGTIDGDLTVAGGVVDVRGNITGSVNVAGGNVVVGGTVERAVRVMGGNVTLTGSVGQDFVAAGGNVVIGSAATIGADVAGGVGRLQIDGTVNGDVLAGSGELTIRGTVGGNVDAQVGQLTIDSGASIAGNVIYASERDAQIGQGAQIGGTVQRTEPAWTGNRALLGENPLTVFLGSLLTLLVLGWGLLIIRPSLVALPGAVLRERPVMAAGAGLAVWVGQFLLVILLAALAAAFSALAASLGLAFIAPIVLVVLAIIAVVLLAQVWVAMAIGSAIAGRMSPMSTWLVYALGAVVWVLVLTILGYLAAVLGGLLFVIAWIVGLGAISLYALELRRREAGLERQPPAPAA